MSKLLISKDGFKVQEIELKNGTITIGRAKDNDVQLNDPTVSGHHAKIVTVTHNSYIEDLDSKNGVFINGDRVVVQALELDDVISIGQHELFYQDAQVELVMEESLGDAALVASAAAGKSASARDFSTFTDLPRQAPSQEPSGNAMENSLRVVVDNTFKSLSPRPLDIDISFEKFVSKSVSLDGSAEAFNRHEEHNAGNAEYIKTHRYFESPREAADYHQPASGSGKDVNALQSKPERADRPSDRIAAVVEKENIKNEIISGQIIDRTAQKPESSTKLVSKQPFMSSEEVVEHLIALSREKKRGRKKSHGLSSLFTIITFGLIAAAIYYKLQLP